MANFIRAKKLAEYEKNLAAEEVNGEMFTKIDEEIYIKKREEKKSDKETAAAERMEKKKKLKELEKACDICGKIFSKPFLVRRHRMQTHFRIRNYKCKYCNNSFSQEWHRNNHEDKICVKNENKAEPSPKEKRRAKTIYNKEVTRKFMNRARMHFK